MSDAALSTCVYGDPKTGKGVATLYAAWDAAYVGPKASAIIEPAKALLGFTPAFQQVLLISQIPGAAAAALKAGYKKLVVDDLSLLASNSEADYKRAFSGSSNRYAPWNAFRADLQGLLYHVCTTLGISVFFTAHEKAMQDERVAENGQTKKALRGGPRLPLGMQEDLPAYMDLVFRVQHSQLSPRGLVRYGWPYVLRGGGADPDYVTGDRLNIAPDCANLNLGEIFRDAGHGDQFKRPALWHEWIEGAVTHYAKLLATAEKDLGEVDKINGELIARGMETFKGDSRPVQWALNDAAARAYLSKHGRRANPFQAWTGLGNLSSVPVVGTGAAALSMDGAAPAATNGATNGVPAPSTMPAPPLTLGAPPLKI
jgi:hypothetical protein